MTMAIEFKPNVEWPDPTPQMLERGDFGTIWETIKTWDIRVPAVYIGHCGATGNHVRAIIDALDKLKRYQMYTEIVKLNKHKLRLLAYNEAKMNALDNAVAEHVRDENDMYNAIIGGYGQVHPDVAKLISKALDVQETHQPFNNGKTATFWHVIATINNHLNHPVNGLTDE